MKKKSEKIENMKNQNIQKNVLIGAYKTKYHIINLFNLLIYL